MSNPTVTMTGRIGADPTTIGSGLRLRIVTNDRAKNPENGEWEDKDTSWFTVKLWGRLAEQSKPILKKGQEVTVVGTIYEENWTDSEGNKRTGYEVKAESIAVTPYSISKLSSAPNDDQFPSYKTYAEVPF